MTQSDSANAAGGDETRPDAGDVYLVVRNDEEQYSIWRADRELPAGWHREGREGSRQECLDHIDAVWTDMRPLSLRRRLAGADV
ncbi:MbtH family NRPS accessory protein [Streptomyces lavendulae]|nr:MbtH family NRPS accessory protein [Streptomyces lavendulae]